MVDRLIVDTGNVRRCQHLANNSETNSEAFTTLLCTLSSWKRHAAEPLQSSNEILGHPKLLERISPSERAQRQITVKLFLLDPAARDVVRDGVAHVCKSLGVDAVDVVLLAAPALLGNGETPLPSDFLAHWADMEEIHRTGLAKQLGASDVSLAQLQELAAKSKVPLSDTQIAFDPSNSPCAFKSLYDFALQHGIRVGTHNDVQDMLPADRFSEAVSTHVASGLWRPRWLARYSVLDPGRSVITNRGYLIGAARA